MITQETAARIWQCYREIGAAEQTLADMAELAKQAREYAKPHPEKLRDAFGRQRDLQLGIPSGDSSHRMLNVSPTIAESVIRAHIANQKALLVEANEVARLELNTAS